MSQQYTQEQLPICLQQLLSLQTITSQQISTIINSYSPVQQPEIPPLKILNQSSLQKIKLPQNRSQLEEQFYQQKFVPSPDLILQYQQIYLKTLPQNPTQNPIISKIQNHKLQHYYTSTNQNPYATQSNTINTPATQPYRNITPNYTFIPPQAQNKHVFIQQREQTILSQLQQGNIGLQASLPVIEKSLLQNQLKRLQQKQVKLQNMGVAGWRQKRKQLLNQMV